MAFRFILLLLPALALAEIEIEVSGEYSGDADNLNLEYYGYDLNIVSETERTTFNVDDYSLKDAILGYVGRRPDNVYVRNPTPYGDFGNKYHVYRILTSSSNKIFGRSGRRTVVVCQTFENNSTLPATFNLALSQSVVNTVSSSWYTSGDLSGIKVNYDIKIKVDNFGGQPSFNYTSSWGEPTLHLQTVTVEPATKSYLTLQPGEAIVALLEATRGFVQVEIEYSAEIFGMVVYDFDNDRSWYASSIQSFMKNASLSIQKKSKEIINIEFYADSKVIVNDLRKGHFLMEVS